MRNTKAAGIVLALVLTISNVYPVMATSAAGGKCRSKCRVGKGRKGYFSWIPRLERMKRTELQRKMR